MATSTIPKSLASDIEAVNSKLLKKQYISSSNGIDANDVTSDGVYMCTGVTTDRHFPYANGILIVLTYNTSKVVQVYYPHPGTTNPYIRMYWDDWSAWHVF